MTRRLLTAFFVSLPFWAVLSPARATTVAPPPNLGALARASQSVTFAEAVESWGEDGETIPVTVTRFHLLQPVAGARTGDVFEVTEPGGRGKERAAAVAGSPRFAPGHAYLLFLGRAPGGRWRARMMAYGLLEEVPGTGLLRPLSAAAHIELKSLLPVEPVGSYRKDALLQHLAEVAKGAAWDAKRVSAAGAPLTSAQLKAVQNSPQYCVFMTDGTDGLPLRWFGFETAAATVTLVATTPGQAGISDGGAGAVQQAMAAWTNHPDSVIRYSYGGSRPRNVTCSANFDYDQGAVIFNDPCDDLDDLSSCQGTLAYGGAIYDPTSTQTHDGQAWHPVFSTFAVVNNGAECVGETAFKETLTHELGHTLGFGHHNPPNPADATMSAFLKNDGRGAAIAIVDKQCASFDYHTFLDVPYNYWTWRWIEAIENAGVTTGCGNGNYCPGAPMTRDEMALFLLRAKEGGSYTPPACTTPMFADVPCSNPYAPWINELVRRGVTAGCGGGNYCPGTSVTRSQMAVFLLATFQGQGWSPPACTTPSFADMPCSSPFAPWVDELARRGVTAGCGGGNYCPNSVVNRDQMAVFLSTIFSLPVPPAPPSP
ncbi:MAG: S-layer homology domain-containing protein [Thermoanaerobaculia bacterium]